MKYIKLSVSITLIALAAMILVNCKNDDPAPLDEQQQAAKKLSVAWGAAEVLSSPVAGADGTLENLTLTFATTESFQPTTFSASGAPDFFLTSANSSWSWETSASATHVLLLNVSPVHEFTIEELTETMLTISFSFDGPIGGRIKGIGEYQVRLTRQ
ncbi:MAG TPA: hypothetical protein VF191_13600 [Cyclobacteriaceae bacterium]